MVHTVHTPGGVCFMATEWNRGLKHRKEQIEKMQI